MNFGRSGLNNDDVKALIKAYRDARQGGAGPDEAWASAKRTVQGVAPEAVEKWREDVVGRAEADPPAVTPAHGNLLQRIHTLELENADLKRRLSDAGARNEEQGRQLAAAEELLNKPAEEKAHQKKK